MVVAAALNAWWHVFSFPVEFIQLIATRLIKWVLVLIIWKEREIEEKYSYWLDHWINFISLNGRQSFRSQKSTTKVLFLRRPPFYYSFYFSNWKRERIYRCLWSKVRFSILVRLSSTSGRGIYAIKPAGPYAKQLLWALTKTHNKNETNSKFMHFR